MSFAPPPPSWISTKDELSGGQDFMALRNPANRIGYKAMDGLTSVTPRVRYLSFREWMLSTWWNNKGADRAEAFKEFARGVEAAIVMANLRAGVTGGAIIGSEKGAKRLAGDEPWSLERLVKNPGAGIYAGATEQLGLDTTQFDKGGTLVVRKVAGPTRERGQKLAAILAVSLGTTRLGAALSTGRVPESATAEELDELAEFVRLDRVPEREREALIDVIMPLQAIPNSTREQRASELRRIGSYGLLLEIAQRRGETPTEQHVFRLAEEGGRELPKVLHPTLDLWALFSVRDSLAAVHEAAMCGITNALKTKAGEGEATSQQVMDELLDQGDALDRILREADIISDSEHWDELGFRELFARVHRLCSDGAWDRQGVRRWRGGLSEDRLATSVLNAAAGPGPLAMLPVVWALTTHRMAPALSGQDCPFFDHLCAHPFPVRPHIEDSVTAWLDEDLTLPVLVDSLARDTVWLHLDTAWRRMQANVDSDSAHLHVEGDIWRPRRVWRPGRGTARLGNAIGWLEQLELMDENGLTPRGRELHEAALATLAGEVSS